MVQHLSVTLYSCLRPLASVISVLKTFDIHIDLLIHIDQMQFTRNNLSRDPLKGALHTFVSVVAADLAWLVGRINGISECTFLAERKKNTKNKMCVYWLIKLRKL